MVKVCLFFIRARLPNLCFVQIDYSSSDTIVFLYDCVKKLHTQRSKLDETCNLIFTFVFTKKLQNHSLEGDNVILDMHFIHDFGIFSIYKSF